MADIPEVPVTDLADDAVMLDVREPNEYAAGRAVGAVSIPLGELRERITEVPGNRPLAIICRSGVRSLKAAEFLSLEGIESVNVAGGTRAWHAAGKPMTSDTGTDPDVVGPSTPPPAQP